MRTPTPQHVLYAWWVASLDGQKPQITTEPNCGWFKRKLVKGGPWVAGRIWMHQATDESGDLTEPEEMLCEVGGKRRDATEEWLWLCNEPISREEYRHMVATSAWAKHHAPTEPVANPDAPVSWNETPIGF